MFLSITDIFKIGVGPSSSHTMGPMVAAARFLDEVRSGKGRIPGSGEIARISVDLYGSLAFTGKGHATDRAVILGLAGFLPETFDRSAADKALEDIAENKTIYPNDLPALRFDPATDLKFDYETSVEAHANALRFYVYDANDALCFAETYLSVGGGFVVTEPEFNDPAQAAVPTNIPFPFRSAAQMLQMADQSGLRISQMKRANELVFNSEAWLDEAISEIWRVMNACIDSGLSSGGILPGGLNTRRRARDIHLELVADRGNNMAAPHIINDWISVYAIAVNEENADGGQVVTAPTNGAAGVVPATLRYWLDHVPGASASGIQEFLLTAAAIGGLVKWNASISGAEVGCQGEVGTASAMAAAGLCAVLGGTPQQIENAAEIALEHHLGMTCDPIKGLVQAPCIERNGLGAIKAVSAASLSMRGDGKHLVSLDACIETMRQTGLDMHSKYKETSLGGLAVNYIEC